MRNNKKRLEIMQGTCTCCSEQRVTPGGAPRALRLVTTARKEGGVVESALEKWNGYLA